MFSLRVDNADQIEQRVAVLSNRLRAIWAFESAPAEITVRQYQDKRTRSQNNLYWRWLGVLAQELSSSAAAHSKDDMHDLMRHKFLGYEDVQIGDELVSRLTSTTQLQKQEMSEYMQKVEAWATDMGVLLPIPADNEYAKYREAAQ